MPRMQRIKWKSKDQKEKKVGNEVDTGIMSECFRDLYMIMRILSFG